jgi:hypothetical protein
MSIKISAEARRKGYNHIFIRDAYIIEWWLHNIGYYLTVLFVTNKTIKSLNERFKHVDLMVEVVECG